MSNPVLTVAPYLIAFSQISRAVAEIVESVNAGEMTPEEARAKWDATVAEVQNADARWQQVDQAARDG